MLNTQNILRAAALLGTCALAAAQQPCVVTPSQVHTIPALADQGLEITKLRAGVVFTPGVNELLALQGTDLVLVRDAMSAPKLLVVANEVADFAVLPEIGGVSRVVVVGSEGLRISTVIDGGPDVGATLSFRTVLDASWEDVTMLDAARSDGPIHIAGAAGATLRRAKWDPSGFQTFTSLQADGSILKVALADEHSTAGVEVALHTPFGVSLYLESGAFPYVSYPADPASVVAVHRIPRGASVRDSVGVWVRTPAADLFAELVDGVFSPPIVGAAWRMHDVSYSAVGITYQPTISTLETDMVVLTQTNEFVALHGAQQAPGALPFVFDVGQFWFHSIPTLLGGANLDDLRLASADFDGDGDGDVAIANNWADDPFFAFVRNDCTYADPAPILEPVEVELHSPTPMYNFVPINELGVSAGIGVRQPPIFNGTVPTHVRVKIYIREYYDTGLEQPPVSPEVWWEDDLDVFANLQLSGSDAPHSAQIFFEDRPLPNSLISNVQLNTENVLAYFEFVPLIKDQVSGVVIQRANATVWVGSMEPDLMSALICIDDFDDFSVFYPPCGLLASGSGQLITEMHRRKVIRPIPPSQVPQ